jgi:type IV pilus assembly protein PilP
MNRLLHIIFLVLVTPACTHKTDDLVTFTMKVQNQAQVTIEAAPSFAIPPAYEYRSIKLRSPFIMPRTHTPITAQVVQQNCLTPNLNRQKLGLEQYGVEAIQLSGFIRSAQQIYALFKTSDGKVYKAQRGDYIGLFHGKITAINAQTIDILQLIPDGAGCYQKKEISLGAERTRVPENV